MALSVSWEAFADHLVPPVSAYQDDPVGWMRERVGDSTYSVQEEIARSIVENRYTCVRSCHAAGKSFSAGRLVTWWIDSHRAGEAFAVTTAPTNPQVKAILWREIRRCYRAGNGGKEGGIRGRLNLTEWWLDDELVAFGRKPSEYDDAAFQGIHAPYVLVVFDEADGVPENLWSQAEGLMTNPDARMLAIGNPYDPQSSFAKANRPGSQWNVIHVPVTRTPAFTGEDVPESVLKQLVSRQWVEERKADWGEGSPLYTSKVLAEFPEGADHVVVPLSWAMRCREEGRHREGPVILGVDPAAGGDESVILERRGNGVGRLWRDHTRDLMVLSGIVVQAIRETGAAAVHIDPIGIGWGVADRLEELRREGTHAARIIRVNVGEAADEPGRFPRKRDEVWWQTGRELTRRGIWDLSNLPEEGLNQLCAVRYSIDSSGRIHVESKRELRDAKRLGRSPDIADALLLAFHDDDHHAFNPTGQHILKETFVA